MTVPQNLLSEATKAFRRNTDEKIIDLDKVMPSKSLFQISKVEDIVQAFQGNMPPNRFSQFYIALITEGKGEKTIGNYEFAIQDNTLMVIPFRGIHSAKNWSLSNKGYALSFSQDFFLQHSFSQHHFTDKLIFKHFRTPYLYLAKREAKSLLSIFEAIFHEYTHSNLAKEELICAKLIELIINCERLFAGTDMSIGKDDYNHTVENFLNHVERQFTQQKSVKFYADILSVHPNYLNAIVKKQTGISAKENIQKRLLLEARYMLASTGLSVKEIAYTLGFEDQNHFSKFFKGALSLSPVAYRQHPL